MRSRFKITAIVSLAAGIAACNSERHSAAGFHLPPDGDIERGKAAFVDLGCNSCHEVAGMDFPKPTIQPPVPVVLGGRVDSKLSDAYLATSIIYPSYEFAPGPVHQIAVGAQSRMPGYADRMTVRQLADTVAFLQSRYFVPRVREPYR